MPGVEIKNYAAMSTEDLESEQAFIAEAVRSGQEIPSLQRAMLRTELAKRRGAARILVVATLPGRHSGCCPACGCEIVGEIYRAEEGLV